MSIILFNIIKLIKHSILENNPSKLKKKINVNLIRYN